MNEKEEREQCPGDGQLASTSPPDGLHLGQTMSSFLYL